MIPLYSEKMLISDPVLESYTTSVSWSGTGYGNTGNTTIYPPVPSGKTYNLNYQVGVDTGITVETGFLYRFTVISNGLDGDFNFGMFAGTQDNITIVSILSKLTNVFQIFNSSGNLRNSMKKSSVGFFTPYTTNNLILTLYRQQTATSFSGSANILIEKLPLDFIKPEYYYFENLSSYNFTWNTTGIAPSGYTRNCAGDIYINKVP